jgi:aminopeptidase YwaD
MRITKAAICWLLIAISGVLTSLSCRRNVHVTQDELRNHIRYLASDSLKGRLTGSPGDSMAAEYIRADLKRSGYIPLSGDGMQRFPVVKKISEGKNNQLVTGNLRFVTGSDFIPLPFSSNDSLEAEVIFAGYGFNINTDTLKWNDYLNTDIKGKWVLLLRSNPEPDNSNNPLAAYSDDRDKAMIAKDLGASGILLVSGNSFDPEDKIGLPDSQGFSLGIPAFRIKRELANIILAHSGNNIDSLEKRLIRNRKPVTFNTRAIVSGNAELIRETAGTRNVVMFREGSDPELRNEYIIMGAHFDHLGMGGKGSSSRAVDTVGIHYGADDNASGVAMMLELAEKFSLGNSHKRSIVCIAFSGEEMGLLGSKQYVNEPGIDLSKVNAMINLDMVGRLNEDKTLQLSGVGTAEGLLNLVLSESDTSIIRLVTSEEGYGPSDHSSFYGKDIPVLFYFTGAHPDYHTPNDTYDLINYDGMVKISDLIYSVAHVLANADSTLSFREAGPKRPAAGRMKGITLGIMPDFAGVVKNGLRADFVTPGKPAALGGMKKGDVIVSIEGKAVNNIEDYMFRMSQLKKGQMITVEVLRGEKKLGLLIQL